MVQIFASWIVPLGLYIYSNMMVKKDNDCGSVKPQYID